MVHVIITSVFWASVAYVVYQFINSILLKRHIAAKRRELKCLEAPIQVNRLPLGIDNIRRALKADREKQFPTDSIKRTHDIGAITYKYSVAWTEAYFTADVKNIQAILATQFADFDLGPARRLNFFPLLGNGIFTQDGKGWEHSRAMMRPQFAREQVSNLDLEEHHIQDMMLALPVNSDKWTSEVDLSTLFFRLTLDSATEFLFGESVNSQRSLLPNADRSGSTKATVFANAFDVGQASLARRARFGDQYWISNPPGFKQACKDCHEFIDHFVRLALSKASQVKSKNADVELEKGDKKPKYVFLDALAQETQDPIELRSQLLNILLAGRDTTASLLGWVFYCLARDPARYAKLRKIIIREFGTYDAATSDPSLITFAKLKSCSYLQQCINETLRLFPVVPINSRRAIRDTTLPSGGGPDGKSPIFVPKNTQVDYSVHVLHHRRDIWGDDAEEFNPERWEGRRVGWEYLPFNGGPRICIGQQFALTEVGYVTVRLVQRFAEVQNLDVGFEVDGGKGLSGAKHNLTLINCADRGVKVRLRVD